MSSEVRTSFHFVQLDLETLDDFTASHRILAKKSFPQVTLTEGIDERSRNILKRKSPS